MELQQLKYFVAAAEEGSFSWAAERMHVAQPSLSQRMQKLEAEVGRLLRRDPCLHPGTMLCRRDSYSCSTWAGASGVKGMILVKPSLGEHLIGRS